MNPHAQMVQNMYGKNMFLQKSILRPNGRLSPMSSCHAYLESYDTQLSFGLSGDYFSASYEASEFCWQNGLNFLQHLRPCHILSLKLEQTKGNPQKNKGNDINKDGDGDKDSP